MITSIGSRSPVLQPQEASSDTQHLVDSPRFSISRSSSSTPPIREIPLATIEPALHTATERLSHSVDKDPFRLAFRSLERSGRMPRVLGRLSEGKENEDFALVHITEPFFEPPLRNSIAKEALLPVAYHSIAAVSREKTRVIVHTASSGRLTGTISNAISYMRLPGSTSFRKVYTAVLDHSLKNGDCGSVIVDADTGATYGHIVAGSRKGQIAYVMAASEVAYIFPRSQSLFNVARKSLKTLSRCFQIALQILLVVLWGYLINLDAYIELLARSPIPLHYGIMKPDSFWMPAWGVHPSGLPQRSTAQPALAMAVALIWQISVSILGFKYSPTQYLENDVDRTSTAFRFVQQSAALLLLSQLRNSFLIILIPTANATLSFWFMLLNYSAVAIILPALQWTVLRLQNRLEWKIGQDWTGFLLLGYAIANSMEGHTIYRLYASMISFGWTLGRFPTAIALSRVNAID